MEIRLRYPVLTLHTPGRLQLSLEDCEKMGRAGYDAVYGPSSSFTI